MVCFNHNKAERMLIKVALEAEELCRFYAIPVSSGMLTVEKKKAYMKFVGCNDELIRKVLEI
jgi:hypothetical protein